MGRLANLFNNKSFTNVVMSVGARISPYHAYKSIRKEHEELKEKEEQLAERRRITKEKRIGAEKIWNEGWREELFRTGVPETEHERLLAEFLRLLEEASRKTLGLSQADKKPIRIELVEKIKELITENGGVYAPEITQFHDDIANFLKQASNQPPPENPGPSPA